MAASPQIRVLPEHVANQIAAGEVVERPASVVKELVENALDAGAEQVDVEITAGGRKLVAVRDDGRGMGRDDAILSLERQATSKIHDVDDIESIRTLGFRGEALAAIASVSRLRLVTCSEGDEVGSEVVVTGGKMADVRDVGCPVGTSMEVRDLFFNVPARRKFLRTYQTEMAHVRNTFMLEALANSQAGMSLTVDGRELYRLPGNGRTEDRIRELFGADYLTHLVPVTLDENGLQVTGFVSGPGYSRADRHEQYVFINQRATSAPVISRAISDAYATLLPKNRQPAVFLYLSLAAELVDVNVHPTKREVRFRRPSEVRDAVIKAVRTALGEEGPLPDVPEDNPVVFAPRAPARNEPVQLSIENLPPVRSFRYPRSEAPLPGDGGMAFASAPAAGPDQATPAAADAGESEPPAAGAASPVAADEAPAPANAPWSWCRVVGIVGGSYVILETEDGYVLMDPRAAHERVIYERFMAQVLEGRVSSQSMLLPETIELRPRDALCVRKNLELLAQVGFGISEFGGDTFVVDALPACFSDAAVEPLLVETAALLTNAGSRHGTERWREEAIAQAASRSAVRSRDRLKLEEVERLVVDLARTEMPYTCPHGRPTLIFTSFTELDGKFGKG